MNRTILFIYGSLKRGQANHRLIADQEYLGEAVTDSRYRIVHLGRYGGLVRADPGGLPVKGELWAVSRCCLGELDDFEQQEGLYFRSPVSVVGRDGVEAYYWTGEVPGDVESGAEWPLK